MWPWSGLTAAPGGPAAPRQVSFPLAPPLQSLISTRSKGQCSYLEKRQVRSVSVVTKAHLVHGQFYSVNRIRVFAKVDQHVQMSQSILVRRRVPVEAVCAEV